MRTSRIQIDSRTAACKCYSEWGRGLECTHSYLCSQQLALRLRQCNVVSIFLTDKKPSFFQAVIRKFSQHVMEETNLSASLVKMAHPTLTANKRPERTSNTQIKKGEKDDKWDEKSITGSYHRIRVDMLPEYVKSLKDNDKEKLKVDARRIERSRIRLGKSESTSSLLRNVQDSFTEWRLDAERNPEVKFLYSGVERIQHLKRLDFVEDTVNINGATEDEEDPTRDLKAGVLFFEQHGIGWKKTTYHGHGFDKYEQFPNQKITVHQALFGKDHNPFSETKDQQGRRHLKYIHLPANHMGWVEVRLPSGFLLLFARFDVLTNAVALQQAIARYYGEHLEPNPVKRRMTNQTLAREFWRGQVHGAGLDKHPIHARHMRARCLSIPLGMESLRSPKTSRHLITDS